jgi:hypothetical protein
VWWNTCAVDHGDIESSRLAFRSIGFLLNGRLHGSYGRTDLPAVNSQLKSPKGEVKKKHISRRWKFSCFAAHWIEPDLF